MRVALFVPCFVDAFRPKAAAATVEVLERLGVTVEFPAEQTCCGQPQFNAGLRDDARELARRFVDIFAPYDAVVGPSGSCVGMIRRHYASLVGEHPVAQRTFELCEFLVDRLGVVDVGAKLQGRCVLHVGCHERRELGATAAVERLVGAVDGLTRLPVDSDEWCCGFGGTFAVKFPELSVELGRRKLEPILRAAPDWLVSTDASCLLHLDCILDRTGTKTLRTLHVAEVLAARGEPPA
ncbi:MAG: (Fe-S)-binding protein [Deltaproteobacteria bacterium]|nr:(Fe-S)-binding protein [Deltaproteobacteria bacterium]